MAKFVRSFVAIVGALLVVGCVTPKDFDDGAKIRAIRAAPADLATPKVVQFATTRCNDKINAGAAGSADELFSKRCWELSLGNAEMSRLGFGMGEGAGVTCGTAAVTVAPFEADKKATTTVDVPVSYDCTDSYERLRQAVLGTPCQCAVVFVHGYNTTFSFGIKRTAQLSVDLGYSGLPIMFSFGAAGRLFDYVNDIEAAELAAPALQRLLATLTRKEGGVAPTVDVIAHSMGGRLTLRALSEGAPPSVRYVVLAAPDVDQAAFLRLAGKAVKHAERMTIYTAKYDVAMSGSLASHGRPRVGAGLPASVAGTLSGAEIIDASFGATDPYEHSYFAESKIVLDDIRGVLAGVPAGQRKPLVCEGQAPSVVACTIPCPEGVSCGPSLYARFVHWLLD